MRIPPGLAAELTLLTQALDLPGTDVAETLTRLADVAHTAVDSYLGLTIAITAHGSLFHFTILNDGAGPEHVQTSLLVPLSAATDHDASSDAEQDARASGRGASASIALILYAATPGAFVDLAADLTWITGHAAGDFLLDKHRTLPPNHTHPTHLGAMSTLNQALGLLIGRGATPEEAERELSLRAAAAGIDLVAAATLILAAHTPPQLDGL